MKFQEPPEPLGGGFIRKRNNIQYEEELEELKADGKELIEEVKSCENCEIEKYCLIKRFVYTTWEGDAVLVDEPFSCSGHRREGQ